jgi:hypothetical protein
MSSPRRGAWRRLAACCFAGLQPADAAQFLNWLVLGRRAGCKPADTADCKSALPGKAHRAGRGVRVAGGGVRVPCPAGMGKGAGG